MGLPVHGRRNKLSALHGPMNQESLNGTAPALLGAQLTNSDVQLPYRFGISHQTHSSLCEDACFDQNSDQAISDAVQLAQDTQIGYSTDYQTKRGPKAFSEIKEFFKGHHGLAEKVRTSGIDYAAKRHVTWFCSHMYGKAC